MSSDKISVKLEAFEGPLDLLLHLLKKNKVSIYDIPILKITEQYLEYLEQYKTFNIELSSEFLLLAAELLLIKSKMLLPKHEEAEEEDPRKDLMDRLLEHQRMKIASVFLRENEFSSQYNFFKSPSLIEKKAPDYSDQNFDIQLLIGAFFSVMDKTARKEPPPTTSFEGIVGREKVSVNSCANYIRTKLKDKRTITFQELFEEIHTRPALVATFLALLEMMKLEMVYVDTINDEIVITQIKDGDISNEQ